MAILSKIRVQEDKAYLQDTQIIGSMLGVVWHSLYLILFAKYDVDILFWFNLFISIPVFLTALICSYKGMLVLPPTISAIEVIIHQVLAVLFLGTDTGFHVVLFCLLPLGILFYNLKVAFPTLSLITLVLFLALSWFDLSHFVRYDLTESNIRFLAFINYLGLFIIVGFIIFYYITLNRNLYVKQKDTSEKLFRSNLELSKQHRTITESIQYAKRIQTAVLTPEDFLSESLRNYFLLFKPRDVVSGDFYFATHKDDKLVIVVADCTGHGVPGALLSMLGISFLNEILNRAESMQANQILSLLRTYLISSLHQTGKKEEAKDGIEMALCLWDMEKDQLEFSGANRPLYLIRGVETLNERDLVDSEIELLHYKADKMPIGIYDEAIAPFNNHLIQLQKNDSVYMFTDGYVDQLGGAQRKTFRSFRLKQLLLDIQHHPMEKQKNILLEQHELWMGENEQIDDILVMGFKV